MQPAREANTSKSDAESCKCATEQEEMAVWRGTGEENGGVRAPPTSALGPAESLPCVPKLHCPSSQRGGRRCPGIVLINSAPLSEPWQLPL